jgi:hypothetical protein
MLQNMNTSQQFQLKSFLYIPLTSLTLPHLCACLKPEPGFPMLFLMSFLYVNGLRWEMIVCFVDTDGNVGHHCRNFLVLKPSTIHIIWLGTLICWHIIKINIFCEDQIDFHGSNELLILKNLINTCKKKIILLY